MAKWAARFALGLSNSVPGLRLKRENIRFENDISKLISQFVGIQLMPLSARYSLRRLRWEGQAP